MENQAEALPRHMPVLDGLRGVAAFIVMFSHATASLYDGPAAPRKVLAVDFFFMLSGLVLAHAYESKLAGGLRYRDFLRIRAVRLYPMLVAASVLDFAVRFLVQGSFRIDAAWISVTVAAVLGLPSPYILPLYGSFPLNPPEWSLFYELVLSALFGIWLFRLSSRGVAATVLAAMAGYVAAKSIYKMDDMPFGVHSFDALGAFCIGILLLRLVASGGLQGRRLPLVVLALPLAAATFVPVRVGWWFDVAAVCVVFPAVIVGGACCRDTGVVTRFLGGISYPLYILHWPIMIACDIVLVPRVGPAAALAAVCVFSVAASWLALKLFDEPVRGWLTTGRVSWALARTAPPASARHRPPGSCR